MPTTLSTSTSFDNTKGPKGVWTFGIVFSLLFHIAFFAILAVASRSKKPVITPVDDEPIAITMLEVSAPTEQWTDPVVEPPVQEIDPIVEPPVQEIEPVVVEPPKPDPVVVEPPKPDPVVVEQPKPKLVDPPKPPDPKPVKKNEPTMEERIAAAKGQGIKKTDPPKQPQQTPRRVSADQLYRPTSTSGAAVHGNVDVAGLSRQETDAVTLYSGIITRTVRDMWESTYGPNGLNNPTPVTIEFMVSSTGMVSSFRIIQPSNSSVMNTQAKALGQALKNHPLTSFKASGISNMPTSPIPCKFELKYENR